MALTLNIIGGGHVGRALGRLFAQQGSFSVQDVLTRSPSSAQDAVAFIGAGHAVSDIAAMHTADVVMVAVSDDQIAVVADQLSDTMQGRGTVVFHCSGAKSSQELASVKTHGAFVASVHPIRSFADPAAVTASFEGTYCGIEGDPQALAILSAALDTIGGRAVQIDAAAKTVYHAAAVFASNYLVTILDASLRAYVAAGVPPEVATELAKPLASETMQNVFRMGARAALSGPIARGDFATVARQQAALDAWDGPTSELYAAMVAATTELAKREN